MDLLVFEDVKMSKQQPSLLTFARPVVLYEFTSSSNSSYNADEMPLLDDKGQGST